MMRCSSDDITLLKFASNDGTLSADCGSTFSFDVLFQRSFLTFSYGMFLCCLDDVSALKFLRNFLLKEFRYLTCQWIEPMALAHLSWAYG